MFPTKARTFLLWIRFCTAEDAVVGSPWSSAWTKLILWPLRPPQAFWDATKVCSAGVTGEKSSPSTPESVETLPIVTGDNVAGLQGAVPPKIAALATVFSTPVAPVVAAPLWVVVLPPV